MFSGNFESLNYKNGFCKGTIVALNKYAPEKWIGNPKNHVFICLFTYTGNYRHNETIRFELDFSKNQQAVVSIENQNLTFIPDVYDINNRITGRYLSSNPQDFGTFELVTARKY